MMPSQIMIYLAQPYSHKEAEIREARYRAARQIVADYTRMGFLIYSPIVHYHEVAKHHDLPTDFEFWQQLNLTALSRCKELWILPLRGWETSIGLREEKRFAKKHFKEIVILDEDAKRLGV